MENKQEKSFVRFITIHLQLEDCFETAVELYS